MKKSENKPSLFGKIFCGIERMIKPKAFHSSNYWEQRYASGGNSGAGSYDDFASFKAEIINEFVGKNDIHNVVEFGCGDGNQLTLANYPMYIGVDVSWTAITFCQEKFHSDSSKSFYQLNEYPNTSADLSLSLDVLYHLIEDDIFNEYMQTLFSASNHYVIIYSSNADNNANYEGKHVKHRKFTNWIKDNMPEWKQTEYIPNRYPYDKINKTGSFADFYIFEKS